MPPTFPKPPAPKPPVSAASAPPAPAKELPGNPGPLDNNLAGRFRRAVSLIDSNPETPPQRRGIIQSFYAFGNASAKHSDFPHSYRPHHQQVDNGREHGKWELFYFHLGSAAIAVQQAYALDRRRDPKAQDQILVADRRLKNLESLVAAGPNSWYVLGDEATGYHLDTKPAPSVGEVVFDEPMAAPVVQASDEIPDEEET